MPARPDQMRLLTIHFAFFQSGASLAGGFIGAYLLRSGFSLAAALAAYAAYLILRSGLRFASLELVRHLGYRPALLLGIALVGLQFLPLLHADRPAWLAAWMFCIAFGESLYWPIYHAAVAVAGDSETRGRQIGLRTLIATAINVVAPLAGACLLTRYGPAADFAIAASLTILAILPLLFLHMDAAGPVPSVRHALRGADRLSLIAFAADGWMSSGLFIAWPMILFCSLGSHYEAFGASNAAAGIAGAAASYLCGRGIDRGQHRSYLNGVCLLLVAGLVMRSAAAWSPLAAAAANLTGAAIGALYTPVLMSTIYDRAKRSGAAFRFHFAAEAGWDIGVVLGCLTGALLAWLCRGTPSIVVLPSIAGIALVYRCIRLPSRVAASAAMPFSGEALAS